MPSHTEPPRRVRVVPTRGGFGYRYEKGERLVCESAHTWDYVETRHRAEVYARLVGADLVDLAADVPAAA